jgi:hypothetical protein
MPLNLAIFLLGLVVSGIILFGLFLFYAPAFAHEVAQEGARLPQPGQGLVNPLDQQIEELQPPLH